jgi:hypothetical protein
MIHVRTPHLFVALGLLVAGVGCSSASGGAESGDDGGGGGGGGAISCDTASASEVGSALGFTGLQDPTSNSLGTVSECMYAASSGSVLIRYETQMTMADFETGEQGFAMNGVAAAPVTGVGDAAYSSSLGSGSEAINTLVVLRNTTEVEISAPATLADLEALAAQIITKF